MQQLLIEESRDGFRLERTRPVFPTLTDLIAFYWSVTRATRASAPFLAQPRPTPFNEPPLSPSARPRQCPFLALSCAPTFGPWYVTPSPRAAPRFSPPHVADCLIQCLPPGRRSCAAGGDAADAPAARAAVAAAAATAAVSRSQQRRLHVRNRAGTTLERLRRRPCRGRSLRRLAPAAAVSHVCCSLRHKVETELIFDIEEVEDSDDDASLGRRNSDLMADRATLRGAFDNVRL